MNSRTTMLSSDRTVKTRGSNGSPVKDGKPVADRVNKRMNYPVAELQRQNEKIIIPTPVLAEVLVRAGLVAGAEYLGRLSGSSAFKIGAFDQRCAIEVAAMASKALKDGNKSGASGVAEGQIRPPNCRHREDHSVRHDLHR